MQSLAQLDDLRALFLGDIVFPESQAQALDRTLLVASEYLRMRCKNAGIDLDAKIENKEISPLLVSDIVANIVKRSYLSNTSGLPGIEVSNYSQSAGGYSASFSPINSGSGFFLRKEEESLLGLNGFSVYVHKGY